MKKVLTAFALVAVVTVLWHCQKSPLPADSLTEQLSLESKSSERELLCEIPFSPTDHSCSAQIRVRCVGTPPGYPWACWYVQGTWNYLRIDNKVHDFNFNLSSAVNQLDQWYDIIVPNTVLLPPKTPKTPLIKQNLLDQYCPGDPGNYFIATVNVGDCFSPSVAQWSMLVDIRSGDRTTTYVMNGATGIMIPQPVENVPQNIAEDITDVDFFNDCTNNGAQGYPIVPGGPVFVCENPNGN